MSKDRIPRRNGCGFWGLVAMAFWVLVIALIVAAVI